MISYQCLKARWALTGDVEALSHRKDGLLARLIDNRRRYRMMPKDEDREGRVGEFE